MNCLIYIICTALGLFFSWMYLMFSMTGGRSSAYLTGTLLVVVHLAIYGLVGWKASKGKGKNFVALLAAPAFIVTAGFWIFLIGQAAISFVQPESDEFTSECSNVGPQYYSLPSLPVRSIAYVWEGKHQPALNHFKLGFHHRISDLGWFNFNHPSAIKFTESGPLTGNIADNPTQFYANFAVRNISADVLVSYKMTPADELRKAASEQGMVSYELNVTDRRDGKNLAKLKYVIDAKKNRACGETGKDKMDEREFVLTAIGLTTK